MELFAHDYFLIEGAYMLEHDTQKSLFLLYQPFIGHESCSLYLSLNLLGNDNDAKKNLELCNLLDINIENLEKARIRLEQYGLLKTYCKKGKINQYIYSLQRVLKPLEFLNHFIFGIQYSERFGKQKYLLLKEEFESIIIPKDNYSDISEKYEKNNLQEFSLEQLETFIHSSKQSPQLPSGFDYPYFLKGMSNIVFPKKLRTDENLALIGQLATIYGISVERMRVLVSRSIDVEKNIFDSDILIKKVRTEKPAYQLEKISGYDLPPVLFLQEKQLGAPVSNTDKRLLEALVNDYHLPINIVNILVEYVLDENNKILSGDYVRKVAATWIMHEVKTEEDAHQLIAVLSRSSKDKEMRQAKVNKEVLKKTTKEKETGKKEPIDKDNLDELEEKLKKLGERYEKS